MACNNNHRCSSCPHPCSSEVKEAEHQKWYASQTVVTKEKLTGAIYPECTRIWNSWTQDERQKAIEESGLSRIRGKKTTALGHDF